MDKKSLLTVDGQKIPIGPKVELNLMLIGCGPCQVPAIEEAHKMGVKVFGVDGIISGIFNNIN